MDDPFYRGGANREAAPIRRASVVIRSEGRYLFSVAADSVRGEFLIPLGGMIEASETPEGAAIREVREEVGVKIEVRKLVAALEETSDFDGETCAGLVFCFLAETPNMDDFPRVLREEDGKVYPLEWLTLEELREEGRPVFPDGLIEALERLG